MRARGYGRSDTLGVEAQLKQHAPMVRRIAMQVASRLPRNVMLDDLIQEGMMGLLDAINRYEPKPGATFETYAKARIRGAIYDSLREEDVIPRHVRDKLTQVERTAEELRQVLGRPPEDNEIASHLGMSIDDYFAILDSAMSITVVDDELPDVIDESADQTKALQQKQLAGRIETKLKELPERERLVLALHYQQDLSFREVAYVMELTPGRISQLHTQALVRLRGMLAKEQEESKPD
ncbi:MAG: FliA/WhiG family RNA polymerase sigma factor [Betaproteobacteria bacterium]|jgi:RNA polymerase sigma factor FliA|nr:FliA/WhiG family RNA polymerase sigma factor [Betaproteobacteria bacterium]NBY54356.1 FliA/WhiG family RNA polymerase sigma factor [Betaproteobacteria bacterium]NDE53479.1 FliA/WhiG family RNA polymerase sigma factor [Actinomycetota bacterium]NDF51488.1 FliA/WhiG family RNA polymerase sigma factor [Betaproteobacteria bacterium]